jgi:hypothetical protein
MLHELTHALIELEHYVETYSERYNNGKMVNSEPMLRARKAISTACK